MSQAPIRPCPCGSGALYSDCCQAYLAGKAFPATAEALMRSRYTAHVRHNIDYVLQTTHPSTRGRVHASQVRTWAESVAWRRLDILDRQKGKSMDEEGTVEFQAWYVDDEGLQCLRERSRFRKEGPMWFYVDGTHYGKPKLDGHAACPCGSGERYKDCCGA
jgi:SEC-C motif-containing protein